ncbi:MAG: MBOAT family protein [Rhizobiaceae bacterium]
MLFNSYEFIAVFLPITMGLFALVRHVPRAGIFVLVFSSIAFYTYWDYTNLPIILVSILTNFVIGMFIANAVAGGHKSRSKWLLALGVTLNLTALAYFKYAEFLTGIAADAFATELAIPIVPLPIGISFFTFTQIAFLVDAQRGLAREYRLPDYGLFVTWFPHLIAGPILHHREMMPQFRDKDALRIRWHNLAIGFAVFTMGLVKKVILADGVAQYVVSTNPLSPFLHAETGIAVTFISGWSGALAYTLQLYFDFSAYSDMAIGLSFLFGIRLPVNFNSPYKSANISEFWRRWHITLSRFLRDYLYISLGGNRRGPVRRYFNLFITMVLGGLWHGAGWTFIIWGAMHGAFLIVYHAFSALMTRAFGDRNRNGVLRRLAGIALTFLVVVVAWVMFRAPSLEAAMEIYRGMAGMNGLGLIPDDRAYLGPIFDLMVGLGIDVVYSPRNPLFPMWLWIGGLLAIAFFMPNTQEIMAKYPAALPETDEAGQAGGEPAGLLTWRPNAVWGVVLAVAFVIVLARLDQPSEFLYFQF